MLIFGYIVSIISLLTYIFPDYYISELTISFLPYLIIIILPIMIGSFLVFKKILKTGTINKSRIAKARGILFVLSTASFLLFSTKFNNFYHLTSLTGEEKGGVITTTNTTTTNKVKIFYANIHKDNTDYTGIENTIKTNNPDIIMFVEFADHHYTHLKDFLQTNYPYINSTTRSKQFIGSIVFSKYKIENWANNFAQGAWRYAYFSIDLSGSRNYFYLVHTSSPDSYSHYVMRNRQLKSFANDIQTHQQGYRDPKDKVIIIGDFNISPWSYNYSQFDNSLETGFINISRQFPILFTWSLKELPLFHSHIDHIWTNSLDKTSNLQSIDIPGSDHKGFVLSLTASTP